MYNGEDRGIIRIQLDENDFDYDGGYRDYRNVSDGSPEGYVDIPQGASTARYDYGDIPQGGSTVRYDGRNSVSRQHHQSSTSRSSTKRVPQGSRSASYVTESIRNTRHEAPRDAVNVDHHRDGGRRADRYDLPLDDGAFVYREKVRTHSSTPVDGRGVTQHRDDRRRTVDGRDVTHHRDDRRMYADERQHYDDDRRAIDIDRQRHDTRRSLEPELSKQEPVQHDTAGRSVRRDQPKTEKRFLRDVQHELEGQREEWRFEIERLLAKGELQGASPSNGGTSQGLGTNSYVDTSGRVPMFTALVDVREFSPRHVSVHLDRITNKVIVKAVEATPLGAVTKTFTHKISLPRFADEQRMTSRMNKQGMLKVEVPLLYHFEQMSPTSGAKSPKSFVYQVNTSRDGNERLEILVNTGNEYSARDLVIEVTDDKKLVISAQRRGTDSAGRACKKTKRLKEYTLPPFADVDRITSRLSKDGRLQVNVPLKKRGPSSSARSQADGGVRVVPR